MSNYDSFSKQEAFAILEGQFLNELFPFFLPHSARCLSV